ncbi:MAG: hypothetical protein KJ058_17475, partial [Thermoanaerobaculia bacterium]|nr:hypothetical protein [Thermoanaerobaculia bacterium]
EEVRVELYFGPLDAQRRIAAGSAVAMRVKGETEPGVWAFEGEVPCRESGQVGYAVRVLPSHPEAEGPLATGLIAWR